MAVQILGAFMTVVAFSVVLNAPKKYLVYSGIVGAAGWWIYLLLLKDGTLLVSILGAGSLIALISHTFARVLKAPVTVFLIPGILPLVPGASIYRSISCLIQGDRAMANYYLIETLQIAGGIALSIFIMDSLFRAIRRRQS